MKKSNWKKSILGVIVGAALVVNCAVPVFATAANPIYVYGTYNISSMANTGLSIDVPWSNVAYAPNLWSKNLSSANQKWTPGRLNTDVMLYATMTIGSSSGQYILQYDVSRFVLRNEYNANVSMAQLDFHTLAGTGNYRILLRNPGLYMAVGSANLNAAITAQGYSEQSNLQKWYVEYA